MAPRIQHFPNQEKVILNLVVPCFNEEEVIEEFHQRVVKALSEQQVELEIIYVNDGSKDLTLHLLSKLIRFSRHRIVDLSRNFGKEAAVTAGLQYASGDAVVVIDADLQDPPEYIPAMIQKWREGYDVVNMKRSKRHGETWLKRTTAALFYRLAGRLAERFELPENVGDFRLLSRKSFDALRDLKERDRFMKGIFAWLGFSSTELKYQRDPRFAGKTKWAYSALIDLAIKGTVSLSQKPLRFLTWGGVLAVLSAGLGTVFYVTGVFSGYWSWSPSVALAWLLFSLGSCQLCALGIMGEYLGSVHREVQARPIFLVNKVHETPVVKSREKKENAS